MGFGADVPWFVAIWLMMNNTPFLVSHLNAMESVIYWFADPKRIMWHAISRCVLLLSLYYYPLLTSREVSFVPSLFPCLSSSLASS